MKPSELLKNQVTAQPSFLAYQQAFVNYLRNPEESHLTESLPVNIRVYAHLLHNKFDGSLSTCFPICKMVLGEEQWRILVRNFIREHHCQSPLYREIPDEFIEFLINTSPPELPHFFLDLAHLEWMELVLETAKPSSLIVGLENYSDVLNRIPVLNPVLYILRYRYPVHTFTLDNQVWLKLGEIIHEQPVILVGLRDKAYQIHFTAINSATARLIELLQEGFRTCHNALIQLAIELKYPAPESIIPFGEEILAQLISQQIIQGIKHES